MEKKEYFYIGVILVLIIALYAVTQNNAIEQQADRQENPDPYSGLQEVSNTIYPEISTEINVSEEGDFILTNREVTTGEIEIYVFDNSFPEPLLLKGVDSRLYRQETGLYDNFTSDDDGVLFFTAEPGLYTVEILPNSRIKGQSITNIEVKPNETTRKVVNVAILQGSFEVTVTNTLGQALPGIEVILTDLIKEPLRTAITNNEGKVLFTTSVGVYGLAVDNPQYAYFFHRAWDVFEGQTTTATISLK
jgi:hypothetical protein